MPRDDYEDCYLDSQIDGFTHEFTRNLFRYLRNQGGFSLFEHREHKLGLIRYDPTRTEFRIYPFSQGIQIETGIGVRKTFSPTFHNPSDIATWMRAQTTNYVEQPKMVPEVVPPPVKHHTQKETDISSDRMNQLEESNRKFELHLGRARELVEDRIGRDAWRKYVLQDNS